MSWTSTVSKICLVGWKDDKTVWQKRGRDRINQRLATRKGDRGVRSERLIRFRVPLGLMMMGLDIAILFRLWQFSKLEPLLYLGFKPFTCCILFRIAIYDKLVQNNLHNYCYARIMEIQKSNSNKIGVLFC